jgi:ssRNA-specific RNase YbeY (16S rRNA maturation enzyme)
MLVGHGILHLFDYSHYDRQSRTNMRFLENMLMDLLGLKKIHED